MSAENDPKPASSEAASEQPKPDSESKSPAPVASGSPAPSGAPGGVTPPPGQRVVPVEGPPKPGMLKPVYGAILVTFGLIWLVAWLTLVVPSRENFPTADPNPQTQPANSPARTQ